MIDQMRTDGEFICQVRALRRSLQTSSGDHVMWVPTEGVKTAVVACLEPPERDRVVFIVEDLRGAQ